jgi:hypothetical protein
MRQSLIKNQTALQCVSFIEPVADGHSRLRAEIRFICMKKYICLLVGAALLAACEQKETTVTNPPAEKKESNYHRRKST